MSFSRATAIGCAAVLAAGLGVGVDASAGGATTPFDVSSGSGAATAPAMLGLPALSTAGKYVEAPGSRTVRPVGIYQSSHTNLDYVSPASPVSEQDAHDLVAGTSSVSTIDGAAVRSAGSGQAGGWFSYRLSVRKHQALTLRVEEAASADAHYAVLINGHIVKHRSMAFYVAQGRPIGLTSYTVKVPAADVPRSAATVTFRNTGDPGDGARIAAVWVDASHGAAPTGADGGAATTPASAGTLSAHLTANFFGRPYVIYDFGHEVAGRVSVRLSGLHGSPQIGFAFSESRQFLTSYSDFSQDPSGIATETHYFTPTKDGDLADPVIRGGFRYLMIFLARPGTATISNVRVRFTADPTNPTPGSYAGSFLSSDAALNKLWYAGAYSVQLSTIASNTGRPYPAKPGPVANDQTVAPGPAFLSDGAKRDRLDWGGDDTVSGVVSYLTTAISDPVKNSIEWFAENPSPDGEVPGVYLPAPSGFQYSWGEYAGWWVTNYWDYYLYTGDKAFLDKYFGTLTNDIAWFQSFVGSDGLLDVPGSAGGHWGYGQTGEETYDNAVYVTALKAAVAAAQAEGREDLVQQWTTQMQGVTEAVNAHLWDAAAGAYVDVPGSTTHPLDANALAVASGIADAQRSASVLSFVKSHLATKYGDLTADNANSPVPVYISPFVSGLELDAYHAAGDAAGEKSVIQRTWDHMLTGDTTGTLWETVGPNGGLALGAYTSMAHGWASSPTLALTTQTLGVTPTTGGFDTFDVTPSPLPGLTWAEGAVPTPHGQIRAAWKTGKGSFSLLVTPPSGTTFSVTVPATATDQLSGVPSGASVTRGATTATITGLSAQATITVTARS